MITWTGLLGKFFAFLGQELLKKAIDARFDKRQLACEAFTRLYFDITKLERLAEIVLESAFLAADRGDSSVLLYQVGNLQRDLERLNSDFLETALVLQDVLEIFDPATAKALGVV